MFASFYGRREARHNRETGYTLVELLIYSSVLVLILTVVGGILLNTVSSERKVFASADANGVSQLIAGSVQAGVRNATALQIAEISDNDELLVVTGVSSDPNVTASARVCQAWYYTEENDGAVYFKRGDPPQFLRASLTAALHDDMTGWTLLGSGVSATPGQPIFTPSVTVHSRAITLNFTINADGEGSPALISTKVTSRQGETPSTEPTCF